MVNQAGDRVKSLIKINEDSNGDRLTNQTRIENTAIFEFEDGSLMYYYTAFD